MTSDLSSERALRMPHLRFAVIWVLSVALFWKPWAALTRLSLDNFRYSHLLLVPFIAAVLIYWKRKSIFARMSWCPRAGIALMALGAALYALSAAARLPRIDSLSLAVFGLVIVWVGGFVLCYGLQPSRAALFPLLFLFLTVPVPGVVLDSIVALLQRGSTEMSHVLFRAVGMPVYREGFRFSLPSLDIEVAAECSSIRSATALFLTGLVTGYAVIRSPWRRACLVALTVPIAIFTNAVRIVTLCWLTLHVDREFLYGDLHRRGGALFSLISVAALMLALFFLSEEKPRWRHSPFGRRPAATPAGASHAAGK